jgi:hypothetical protein
LIHTLPTNLTLRRTQLLRLPSHPTAAGPMQPSVDSLECGRTNPGPRVGSA